MLRKLLATAGICAGLLAGGMMVPAMADDVDVDIGIGLGGVLPGPGYGGGGRISCRQGARIVRSAGYRSVRPVDCSGSTFEYRGLRRDRLFEVTVRSRSGRIIDVRRLRGGGGWDDDDWD